MEVCVPNQTGVVEGSISAYSHRENSTCTKIPFDCDVAIRVNSNFRQGC